MLEGVGQFMNLNKDSHPSRFPFANGMEQANLDLNLILFMIFVMHVKNTENVCPRSPG